MLSAQQSSFSNSYDKVSITLLDWQGDGWSDGRFAMLSSRRSESGFNVTMSGVGTALTSLLTLIIGSVVMG